MIFRGQTHSYRARHAIEAENAGLRTNELISARKKDRRGDQHHGRHRYETSAHRSSTVRLTRPMISGPRSPLTKYGLCFLLVETASQRAGEGR